MNIKDYFYFVCVSYFTCCLFFIYYPDSPKTDKGLYPVSLEPKLVVNDKENLIKGKLKDTLFQTSPILYHYIVYNMEGKLVKEAKGKGERIQDMLPAGYYYFVILTSYDMSWNNTHKMGDYFTDRLNYKLAFHASFCFEVKNSMYNLPQTVYLESIWNELYLEITDIDSFHIQKNVDSITPIIIGEASSFYIKTGEGHFNPDEISKRESISISALRELTTIPCLISYPCPGKEIKILLQFHFKDETPTQTIYVGKTTLEKKGMYMMSGSFRNILNKDTCIRQENLFKTKRF